MEWHKHLSQLHDGSVGILHHRGCDKGPPRIFPSTLLSGATVVAVHGGAVILSGCRMRVAFTSFTDRTQTKGRSGVESRALTYRRSNGRASVAVVKPSRYIIQ